MSEAIKGKSLKDNYSKSDAVTGVEHVLDAFNSFVDQTPAIQQPQRFGNKAYRDWFQKMDEVNDRRK